jgi:lysophospholipase L1-like esterase
MNRLLAHAIISNALRTAFEEFMQRRIIKLLYNILASAVGCLVAYLLCEALVRVLDLPPRPLPALNLQSYQLASNPVRRFEYRPSLAGKSTTGGDAEFMTNIDGFRDRGHEVPKQQNTKRIIVLGDSITAGQGVSSIDHAFPRQLELLLNRPGSPGPVEVFNMGVGGYNTLQEVESLSDHGIKYKPDVVIIAFCINDFSWKSSIYDRLREQLTSEDATVWRRGVGISAGWARSFVNRSRFAFFAYNTVYDLFDRQTGGVSQDDRLELLDPVSEGFTRLAKLQRKFGFEVWIFAIPGFDSLFSDYPYSEIHNRARALASQFPEFQFVDLLSNFTESATNPSGLSTDGLHPNDQGHEMLALYVADSLNGKPAPAMTKMLSGKRHIILNSSFEVEANGWPAAWFSSHPEAITYVADADTRDGTRCLDISCDPAVWSDQEHDMTISQQLRIEPGYSGHVLRVSADVKASATDLIDITVQWSEGMERRKATLSIGTSANTWERKYLDVPILPNSSAASFNLFFTVRARAGHRVRIDAVQAELLS